MTTAKSMEATLLTMQMKADMHYKAKRLQDALTGWTVAANYAEAIGKDEAAKALRERVAELTPKT